MESKSIDFAAIPQTALKVLTNPAAFFREMPKTGGFVEPLIFMVAMGLVGGVLQTLFSILRFSMLGGMAMGLASIIVTPVVVGIFGFIAAGIVFVIWKILGSSEEYEAAYRCIAYISALAPITTLLGLIPYVGVAVGLVLTTYYLVVASVEVHGIPSQKAWVVFGVLAGILIIISISGQIAARRVASNMEQFTESMKNAAEQAKKTAEEMQRQMQKQMPPAK